MSPSSEPLLEVENLEKHYPITDGYLNEEVARAKAVDGISFELERGETVGIVGESGCGKSTAAKAMIRLEEPTDGEIRFDSEDVMAYDEAKLRKFRREVQMIFQDPDSSFDPRMSVGESVAEPLTVQGMADEDRRRAIVADLLERVGLSASDMDRYPHEFSGGQKQRIGLARALSVNPELIVADEPVSALDVSVQSEILKRIDQFQESFGLTVLIISHNLGVVREICDRVAVMYLGEFVEVAPTEELFADPQHPYTKALLSSIPRPDPSQRGFGQGLTGDVPDPSNPPSGCRFHTRCPAVIPPDDIDVPQGVWRSVLQFRKNVQNDGVDLESIVRVHALESDRWDDPTAVAPEDVDEATLATWIRDEYDLPQRLPDETAETTLARALERTAAGNLEAAANSLEEQFSTVCEHEKPVLESVESDRKCACHLVEATGTPVSSDDSRSHEQLTD
ncbi:ABC transporter ATP-binding protein [Natronobacterium gregoryi]|uniref:ABC transporter ATP-binding protein n=2 Tax=Natronobacterium gregoryi TaxID=44930 RepID=L0ADX3_NATGS|nr:oligopeptide/dipeptide ABC transporter ATP-binding protein [Natronobacterium gregoryi]AFZ72051.1 oligopeptide/dipeptide ABC transporter, ATP-binding protein [Natronobacterium gregoryi SP2]ELY62777.1 peptide ABC transporter ATPase [Natronobacterium gregoryi SP2]PLK20899.1 ABC transporter ATP-binding protein [Natronobacterium gregoryi SP2]SFJ44974.1 peptide/nickel transport system ATP-binding protein [Natronobacterium gregoryi]